MDLLVLRHSWGVGAGLGRPDPDTGRTPEVSLPAAEEVFVGAGCGAIGTEPCPLVCWSSDLQLNVRVLLSDSSGFIVGLKPSGTSIIVIKLERVC